MFWTVARFQWFFQQRGYCALAGCIIVSGGYPYILSLGWLMISWLWLSLSLIVWSDNLVMHSHAHLVYYIILCLLLLGFTLLRPYHQSSAIGHRYRFCSALKYWSVMFVCSTDCSGFLCVLKPIVTDQGLKLILCYFSILHRLLIICYVTFLELNFILGKWFWQ